MPEVDPKRKKSLQEVLDRMERGFDENMLDPLLESIYKEDEKGQADPEPLPSESKVCLLYTSPSPRDYAASRMPSSA